MLRFRHRMQPRKIPIFVGSGPEGRIKRLQQIVTGLIRYERIEATYPQADEARQYAERLLYLAVKNGDRHQETMDLADYWLLEKDLVHKLFKVLAPRYERYNTCFTDLHKLAVEYPGSGKPRGLLELRGNPWPSVVPQQRDTRYLLSNILMAGARKDYHIAKQKALEEAMVQKASTCVDTGAQQVDQEQLVNNGDGSSVDAETLSDSPDSSSRNT